MPARKTNSPDLQRLARGRLGTWRFGLKFARHPKAVVECVQAMAKENDELRAERDRLTRQLVGKEVGDKKKRRGHRRSIS